MSVYVGLEISDISKDELRHECFCGVGDLKMTMAMHATVGLEISDLSKNQLCCV